MRQVSVLEILWKALHDLAASGVLLFNETTTVHAEIPVSGCFRGGGG